MIFKRTLVENALIEILFYIQRSIQIYLLINDNNNNNYVNHCNNSCAYEATGRKIIILAGSS